VPQRAPQRLEIAGMRLYRTRAGEMVQGGVALVELGE